MENGNENSIEVSDLGLASLLVTLGFELIDMKKADRQRLNFLFKKTNSAEVMVKTYWLDQEISVRVQTLFNNQKSLKNRIFAMK